VSDKSHSKIDGWKIY